MKSGFKKHAFNALLFFFLTQALPAQINESDTMKMQLQISLTGNYQRGNFALITLRSRNEFLIRPFPDWAYKTQVSNLYTKFSDRQIDNDIFSRNALYYKPERRIYGYVTAFVSTNFRRKISYRYFIASGPTWQAIQAKALVLKLSANMVYENTLFRDTVFNQTAYNGKKRIIVWRSSLYAGGWAYAFNNKLRMNYEFYWQPAYNNRKNFRTQFEVGLNYLMWKGLAFNTVYIVSHENVVVEKVKREDRILTFGLSYLFKRNTEYVN